jgi:hypothetical protein
MAGPSPDPTPPDDQLTLFDVIDQDLAAGTPEGYDDMNLVDLVLGIPRTRALKQSGEVRTPWEKGERHFDIEITETSYRAEWEGVVTEKGKTVRKRFYRSVTCAKGIPEHHVNDVMVALLSLSEDAGFSDRILRTTRYELLKLMGWPTTKHYYDRLEHVIDQLQTMTVETNALWNPQTQTHWKFAFNVLDSHAMDPTEDNPVGETYVAWAPTMFQLISLTYGKTLSTRFYYALPNDTVKLAYRWLDKRFLAGSTVEMDVIEFANRILNYRIGSEHPSQIISKLGPHFDTLAERGYCSWEVKPSKTASGKKFVFTRTLRFQCVLYPSRQAIVSALVGLGVEPAEAETLVREYGWNLVVRQLEHYHWAVAGGKEIKSPRAWIKSAIRYRHGEGYRLPPTLEKEIAEAYRETERWCTEIYRSLTEAEQAEINGTVHAALDSAVRDALTHSDPEARRTFLRERNRLLLDRLSRRDPAES